MAATLDQTTSTDEGQKLTGITAASEGNPQIDVIIRELTAPHVTPECRRKMMTSLENAVIHGSVIKSKIETKHQLQDGLYTRQIYIPKGMLVIGKIHKKASVSVMTMGSKLTITEDGVNILEAPFVDHCKPGIKRIGIALEDTIWTTIHATNETSIEAIEKDLIAESFEEVSTGRIMSATTWEGL